MNSDEKHRNIVSKYFEGASVLSHHLWDIGWGVSVVRVPGWGVGMQAVTRTIQGSKCFFFAFHSIFFTS